MFTHSLTVLTVLGIAGMLVVHAQDSGRDDRGVHIAPEEWSYVALGGDHRRRAVGARVRYAGSLERAALDPWPEAADEKGFLTVDLRTGHVAFHAIPGRPVVALAPVRVTRGDAEHVRRKVRQVTAEVPGGIAGKIVLPRAALFSSPWVFVNHFPSRSCSVWTEPIQAAGVLP